MSERPEIVVKLEDRVQNLLLARQLTNPSTNNDEMDQSPLTAYDAITKDPNVTRGVHYLALHCIVNNQGLYRDPLERSQILEVISQEMGNVSLAEVVQAIQYVKINYEPVYHLGPRFFDRAEANAKGLMTQLPGDRQGQSLAQPKDPTLKPIPVSAEKKLTDLPRNPPAVAMPNTEEQYTCTYTQEPFSQIYNKTALPNPTLVPHQSANKGAFFIGGGVIAGAMIVSTSLMSPQASQTSANVFDSANSNQLNSALKSVGTTAPAQSRGQISENEAKSLIERWQQAKIRMFAPPYDQQIGAQLATGKTYADQVKGPSSDGTSSSLLEWLRQYGFSYKYSAQDIERITRFESSGDQATIEVQMIEEAKLYDRKGQIQPDLSGTELKIVRFILKKENGILKISDYGAISTSRI